MTDISREDKTTKGYLLPLAAILFTVPLIVYMTVHGLEPIEIAYWKGGEEHLDFFSYAKMATLLGLTAVSIVFAGFYFKWNENSLRKTSVYIPMGVYALFVIISTLATEHPSVAMWGFVDRYEGMLTTLAYIMLMFIALNLVDDEGSIKRLIYPLMASATIIGIIGVFQYVGADLFQTDFGKKLILPMQYREMAETLSFTFGAGTIYSTLYNTNYVGSYTAIIFALAMSYTILLREKKKKIIFGALSLLMFVTLIGSNSRGGMIGTAVAVLIALALFRSVIKENKKIALISLGVLLIGFIAMNQLSDGRAMNQVTRLKDDILSVFDSPEGKAEDAYIAKELVAEDNELRLVTNRETIVLKLEDDSLAIEDGEGEVIAYDFNPEDGTIAIEDQRYEGYSLRFLNDGYASYIEMTVNGQEGKFALVDGEFKQYLRAGITRDIEKIETFGFEGKERLGSNRGYIWSRTIPMMKDTIIIGHGPDTYAIYYPQNDFIGGFNTGIFRNNTIVDKPHNIYLQIAINTGLVSLIAFLAMMIIYIVQSSRIYFKSDFRNYHSITGVGIFLAVIGYLVAGVFNDSIVGVAPVFWILLGTGFAINYKIKSGELEEEN